MNYTESNGFAVHTGTGQRMHEETQAVPTAISDKDLNQVIWSLMEIIKAAGLAGVSFDPSVPTSYQVVLQAIQTLNAQASSDIPGKLSMFLQPTAPPGWIKPNGALLSRTTYARLWTHVESVGAVSELDWANGRRAWFSSGDGSTTFRIPDLRGQFPRFWDDGAGIDLGRLLGSLQASQNLLHGHGATVTAAPDHQHSGVTDSAGAHAHDEKLDVSSGGTAGLGAQWADGYSGYVSTELAGNHFHSFLTAFAGGHGHTVTIEASGGNEARPVNAALPVYMRYL